MDIVKNLFSRAKETCSHAHAPYSHFRVGAAILADDNKIYTGCNVENASYPCGTCAEAGAIASMIANGATQIREILVIADSQELITPCGACRQRIAEFSTPETLVHLANFQGIKKTLSISELLPYSFNPEELKK